MNLNFDLHCSKLLHKKSSFQINSRVVYFSPLLNSARRTVQTFIPGRPATIMWNGTELFSSAVSQIFFFFSFEQEMLILRPLSDLLPFPRDLTDSWCSGWTSSLHLTNCSLEKYRTFSCCNMNTFLFCQHWGKQN